MQAKTTPAVRIAVPNRRGRTHIVAHKEEGVWARTACNHRIQPPRVVEKLEGKPDPIPGEHPRYHGLPNA